MEISFVLISLMVFANVLADNRTEYAEVVDITNQYIKHASNYTHSNVGNVLEYVINLITNVYSTETMNYMFTVPDAARIDSLKFLEESKIMQEYVQKQIRQIIGRPEPNNLNQNLNLADLGKARRVLTGKALRNIIARKLDKSSQNWMCKLLGLWMSTRTSLLTFAENEGNIDCKLSDRDNHVIKYRYFEGNYFQIDEMEGIIGKLKTQLLEEEYAAMND
ncbi:uncharacterized protein LOC126835481 isoform X1 [Adelges cooleyi]|uniref:uncharacterized protein LOC126835481 isoform X1 n=1 Tax=Adelges cooleyi TaxID=133065 RepID=UPI00218000D1|nr:uncharacterized protein LOC126835481 isoform X1 [Adelges cooleyi]